MPEYQLYCFAQSGNSYKVALMLSFVGADWAPIFVDFFGNRDTRSQPYRADVNEMGEAPVLVHKARKLSQSGAILAYLAQRSGQLGGRDEIERYEIQRWILFDNHRFTAHLATHRFLTVFAKAGDPAVIGFLRGRVKSAFAIVENHLTATEFTVGSTATIVDISMCGYLFYPAHELWFDLAAEYPAISAWLGRIKALPRRAHPHDLMPGHPLADA
jgi:glutathione S-transferase